MLSVAVAVTVTVFDTDAPAAGERIRMLGGVVSVAMGVAPIPVRLTL
jgi:hypothetical protein